MAAAVAYLPKGHRNSMNSFPRVPRSGSQTWGPGSSQVYNQHNHYTHMSAQAVFYHPPMKQDYIASYSGNYGSNNNGAFDSPASSSSSSPDNSAQGSPRSFEPRHSISSGYDLSSSEEAISNLSSPASDDYLTNSYFPDQFSADRGTISMESSGALSNNPAHVPVVPVQSRDPRATSPPQYSSPNRSRQGSTSFSPTVTTEQRNAVQQKSDELPVSPTNRTSRGQKQARNSRRGGGGGGGQQKDFYIISAPHIQDEPVPSDDDDFDEPMMVTTLNARAQLTICKKVDEILRACLFWWLVTYKFDIPRNPRARDIETADDRDYEGFCSVVNDLTAKRWVPREAVHHERIAELNTVLAGPSEIRHMLAHPERHIKSDWRMLGLIAAAIEVCKILQYRSGHRELFRLYQETDARICAIKAERLEAAMADISISKDDKPLK